MNNLEKLIEDLIKTGEIDNLIKEKLNIDPNIELIKSNKLISKELYDVNVNDKQYELSSEEMMLGNKKIFIEFNFRLKNYKELKHSSNTNPGIETGITNTGDSKLVFDRIVSTIVAIINQKHPDYITFQARESKRQKLYNFVIKQALEVINNYKRIYISPITNEKVDESEFWLEKL
jgi:hypothetical protein